MLKEFESRPIIIAGPCAAESRQQVTQTIEAAKLRNVDAVRLSLWKPRTRPGFDGIGEEGIPWLIEVAQAGIIPATEVMLPSHAEKTIDGIIKRTDKSILIWLGSRNQNHQIQQEIARVIAGEQRVMLMIKNQPWRDKDHWEGIIDHVLSGGVREDQLILCHRGFAPGTNGFRNTPDLEMALDLKDKKKLPVILDPSHIGGSAENVLKIAKEGLEYKKNGRGFDGMMVEVHPDPTHAATDGKQQLTWAQFDSLLRIAKNH